MSANYKCFQNELRTFFLRGRLLGGREGNKEMQEVGWGRCCGRGSYVEMSVLTHFCFKVSNLKKSAFIVRWWLVGGASNPEILLELDATIWFNYYDYCYWDGREVVGIDLGRLLFPSPSSSSSSSFFFVCYLFVSSRLTLSFPLPNWESISNSLSLPALELS